MPNPPAHHWPLQKDIADAAGSLSLYHRGRFKQKFGRTGVGFGRVLHIDEIDPSITSPFALSFWATIGHEDDDGDPHGLVTLGGSAGVYYQDGVIVAYLTDGITVWQATSTIYGLGSGLGTPVTYDGVLYYPTESTWVATSEEITVECWGGGGGASANVYADDGGGGNYNGAGYGGGGGAYSRKVISGLTIGATYAVVVGAGGGAGDSGADNSPGLAGSDSYFGDGSAVLAKGGGGGGVDPGGSGGQGGQAAASAGDTKLDGGDGGGAVGSDISGGAGGGAAGDDGEAGNTFGDAYGGNGASDGGRGGHSYALSSGEDGQIPGGGGASAAGTTVAGTNLSVGKGAPGRVVITPTATLIEVHPYRKWVHVCLTYDGGGAADGLKLYIDAKPSGVGEAV